MDEVRTNGESLNDSQDAGDRPQGSGLDGKTKLAWHEPDVVPLSAHRTYLMQGPGSDAMDMS